MSYNLAPINHFGRVKTPCGDCDGDVCTMNCSPRERIEEKDGSQHQQLVARIKRGSKYRYQAPAGDWFNVERMNRGYPEVEGNRNCYRVSDLVFGVRLDDGSVVELKP